MIYMYKTPNSMKLKFLLTALIVVMTYGFKPQSLKDNFTHLKQQHDVLVLRHEKLTNSFSREDAVEPYLFGHYYRVVQLYASSFEEHASLCELYLKTPCSEISSELGDHLLEKVSEDLNGLKLYTDSLRSMPRVKK